MPGPPALSVPSLSVVVPCFNVEPYAAQTLAGLARNADPRIEFVLVDDASTDGTPALLGEAAERLPGATLLTSPVNRGVAAARNDGVAVARGRWLTFLDGDDLVAPGYYAELLAVAERLGADFLRTDHVQVRGRERSVHRVPYGPRGVVRPARSGIGPPHRRSPVDVPFPWAGVYSARLRDAGLLRFDETLRTCEDREWAWRLHRGAGTFAVVGLRGVRYRRLVTTSLTQVADDRQLDFVPAFLSVIRDVRTDPEADRLLPKAVRSLCALTCFHLAQVDRYPEPLAARLRQVAAAALAGLPAAELDPVVAGLDRERADTITALRQAA